MSKYHIVGNHMSWLNFIRPEVVPLSNCFMTLLYYFDMQINDMFLRPELIYYVIYGNVFFRYRVRGTKKKSSVNDQLSGHFQRCFF